eukprot:scaffold20997_cov34-Prasinocladus_malaysianus.AAC.1
MTQKTKKNDQRSEQKERCANDEWASAGLHSKHSPVTTESWGQVPKDGLIPVKPAPNFSCYKLHYLVIILNK